MQKPWEFGYLALWVFLRDQPEESKQCVLGCTSVLRGVFSGASGPLFSLLRLQKGISPSCSISWRPFWISHPEMRKMQLNPRGVGLYELLQDNRVPGSIPVHLVYFHDFSWSTPF